MSAIDLLAEYALVRMEEGHLEEVMAIERMSYTNPWVADAFRHEIAKNAFSRPRVAVTLTEPADVAGYCVSWVVFEQVQIQNIAVHPRHRRRGLARHLMMRALEDARDGGARTAHLEVRKSNVVARKLYASLGFQETGERQSYYARPVEDAILLQKVLG